MPGRSAEMRWTFTKERGGALYGGMGNSIGNGVEEVLEMGWRKMTKKYRVWVCLSFTGLILLFSPNSLFAACRLDIASVLSEDKFLSEMTNAEMEAAGKAYDAPTEIETFGVKARENYVFENPFPINDNFSLDEIKTVARPAYSLAENFPQDKIKIFEDFIAFCAVVEGGEIDYNDLLQPISIRHVRARLACNVPLEYGDFLAAVSFSLTCVPAAHRKLVYSPSLTSFFIDNVLEPLSRDLAVQEYRGYHFPENKNLPEFFRAYAAEQANKRKLYESGNFPEGGPLFGVPREIELAQVYVNTFLNVHKGRLDLAYSLISPTTIDSGGRTIGLYRPYYHYSDEERRQWFLFFQEELRHAGHAEYADEVLTTELEHYRELIVWQLQERAHFVKKLYASSDSANLPTLEELLGKEYAEIKKGPSFVEHFNKSCEELRQIDEVACAIPEMKKASGILVLPWIDRKDLDRRQGIKGREGYEW
jgi:hypothetical protein